MNKYSVEAAHIINLYMWDKMTTELPEHWKPIRGMSAIIPAQEQPEMTESGQNYMTYVYMDQGSRDLYALQYQNIDWTIFSPSATAASSTIALSRDLFGRYDESAREVNRWVSQSKFADNEFVRRYIFKQIQVTGSTSSQPATDEGGTMDAMLSISYSFIERA